MFQFIIHCIRQKPPTNLLPISFSLPWTPGDFAVGQRFLEAILFREDIPGTSFRNLEGLSSVWNGRCVGLSRVLRKGPIGHPRCDFQSWGHCFKCRFFAFRKCWGWGTVLFFNLEILAGFICFPTSIQKLSSSFWNHSSLSYSQWREASTSNPLPRSLFS